MGKKTLTALVIVLAISLVLMFASSAAPPMQLLCQGCGCHRDSPPCFRLLLPFAAKACPHAGGG